MFTAHLRGAVQKHIKHLLAAANIPLRHLAGLIENFSIFHATTTNVRGKTLRKPALSAQFVIRRAAIHSSDDMLNFSYIK